MKTKTTLSNPATRFSMIADRSINRFHIRLGFLNTFPYFLLCASILRREWPQAKATAIDDRRLERRPKYLTVPIHHFRYCCVDKKGASSSPIHFSVATATTDSAQGAAVARRHLWRVGADNNNNTIKKRSVLVDFLFFFIN